MQNLDEKIDLILETSLDEAPARIGALSTRDLLGTKIDVSKDDMTRALRKASKRNSGAIYRFPAVQNAFKKIANTISNFFDFSNPNDQYASRARARLYGIIARMELEQDERRAEEEMRRYAERIEKLLQFRKTPKKTPKPQPKTSKPKPFVSSRELEKQRRKKQQQRPETWLDISEQKLNEDKLVEITINFSELRKQQMNESFLAMFGGWVEHILQSMFGGSALPVNVVGSRREVESFATTIGREKKYIESARRHGLDHPMTYKNKSKLDVAVKNFEKDTGLKWPFK